MITYQKICKKAQVARSLVGMSLVEFDQFYAEFEIAYAERRKNISTTCRGQKKRQRAVGAGRKYKYDLRDRLLMIFSLAPPARAGVAKSIYNL
jgi:hypothetical protein